MANYYSAPSVGGCAEYDLPPEPALSDDYPPNIDGLDRLGLVRAEKC